MSMIDQYLLFAIEIAASEQKEKQDSLSCEDSPNASTSSSEVKEFHSRDDVPTE